jgi:PHD/YefM family antitoxin component YafN of YafNO toxin-antitoxin module
MATITANQQKTKGVSALESIIDENKAAIVTVRGQDKYVVMDIETYNHLRECELEAAIIETKRELEQGEILNDSIDEHIKRIADAL